MSFKGTFLLAVFVFCSMAWAQNNSQFNSRPQVVSNTTVIEEKSNQFFDQKVDQLMQKQKQVLSTTFPYLTKVYELSQDKSFKRNIEVVKTKWHARNFFISQVIAFFMIALFRAYLQDLSDNWFERFLTGLFCSAISIGCFVYLVPRLFFGPSYWELITQVWSSGILPTRL